MWEKYEFLEKMQIIQIFRIVKNSIFKKSCKHLHFQTNQKVRVGLSVLTILVYCANKFANKIFKKFVKNALLDLIFSNLNLSISNSFHIFQKALSKYLPRTFKYVILVRNIMPRPQKIKFDAD